MAYRKVNEDSLVSVAEAIRAKSGTTDALEFPEGFAGAIAELGGGLSLPEWMTALEFATVTFSAADQTVINIPCTLGAKPSGFFILSPVNTTPADNYYYWKYFSYPVAIGYTVRGVIGAYSSFKAASVNNMNQFYDSYVSYADNMLSIDMSSRSNYCFEEDTPYYCMMWI